MDRDVFERIIVVGSKLLNVRPIHVHEMRKGVSFQRSQNLDLVHIEIGGSHLKKSGEK